MQNWRKNKLTVRCWLLRILSTIMHPCRQWVQYKLLPFVTYSLTLRNTNTCTCM